MVVFVVSWLLNVQATCKVYLRDTSAQTNVCAATLRQKLQIKLAFSSRHSMYIYTGATSPGTDPAALIA